MPAQRSRGAMALGLAALTAAPALAGATGPECLFRLAALDASGSPVVQTDGYSAEAPGTLVVPLSLASAGMSRWERLLVTPLDDGPGSTGPTRFEASIEDVLRVDRDRDLAFLSAPGLPPCDTGADREPAETFEIGAVLSGVRARRGYRGRDFAAVVARRLRMPGDVEVLLLNVLDEGGAESGFLLDATGHLAAVVLPPPPGGDPGLAAAVRYGPDPAAPAGVIALRDALAGAAAAGPPPVRLFAQSFLLTRHDQGDQALKLLDQVARLTGEFDDLVLERGNRRFEAGGTEMAIEDFARLSERSPGLFTGHYNLGVALGAAGRLEEAIRAFQKALALDPGHARARFQIALALRAAGHGDSALLHYRALETLDGTMALELKPLLGL